MSDFFLQHGAEVGRLTFEHLWLTGFAMLFAAGIGIPLGILLTRTERLARPVLAVANILQTIPSLALFGLLLAGSMAGRTGGTAGNCCPYRIRAPAHPAQHLRRNPKR